jgi:hypothetical protein
MGRKGDSKRKTSQNKIKPAGEEKSGSSVSSALKGPDTSAHKSSDAVKTHETGKPASGQKKNSKKG